MGVTANKLRDFVQIQAVSSEPDEGGGRSGTWVTVLEDYAWVERTRSLGKEVERMSAGGVASQPLVRIWMRASEMSEAITTKMRAYDVDRSKYFKIHAVQDIAGDGRWVTITATENAPS